MPAFAARATGHCPCRGWETTRKGGRESYNRAMSAQPRPVSLPGITQVQALAAGEMAAVDGLIRGRRTANALWGNAPSVLVGDFLYSRSFQLMVELDSMPVMRILADTTNQIAEGEVLQLLHVHNPDTDEAAYLRVIERKTAVLFAAATRLGALLSGADETIQQAMHAYGMNLGLAFQIADDVLDYTADADALGKNLGDDLAEGKATLPLIHAMAHAGDEVRARLREAIETGDADAMPEVLAAIGQSGGIDYSRERAAHYADRAEAALDALPDSEWSRALRGLARYAVARGH